MDKFPEHDPRCGRQTEGQWYSQPQDIVLADTPECSQSFFAEVFKEFPTLATSVVFLRWSVGPDHLYAIFNFSSGGFGVQIDPGLEYIYVWGAREHGEYGDWMGDRDRLAESARSCPYQASGGLKVCLMRLSDDETSAGW